MKFLMVVNDVEIARYITSVPDISPFVDLEYMGKADRQGHLSTWKSKQTPVDVTRLREAVPDAHLVVRVNPLHQDSAAEIEDVIARGANTVMLPMFFDQETLARFLDILGGRAEALPLFETAASVAAIPEMIHALPLKRVHIGMNDLHLDLGHDFLFQPLAEGYLEAPAAALRAANIGFGIGGIARSREGIVSPEILLGEHVRLGSDAAILSQTFHRNAATLQEIQSEMDFSAEVQKLRDIYASFEIAGTDHLARNRVETHDKIRDVAQLIKTRKAATQ